MSRWKLAAITVGAALLNWVIQSAIHAAVSEDWHYSQHFLRPDSHEIALGLWSTVLVGSVVVVISRFIQAKRVVQIMEGLIPICAWCRNKIRTETDEWQTVDAYISERGEVEFTHGMCPDCYEKTVRKQSKAASG